MFTTIQIAIMGIINVARVDQGYVKHSDAINVSFGISAHGIEVATSIDIEGNHVRSPFGMTTDNPCDGIDYYRNDANRVIASRIGR